MNCPSLCACNLCTTTSRIQESWWFKKQYGEKTLAEAVVELEQILHRLRPSHKLYKHELKMLQGRFHSFIKAVPDFSMWAQLVPPTAAVAVLKNHYQFCNDEAEQKLLLKEIWKVQNKTQAVVL